MGEQVSVQFRGPGGDLSCVIYCVGEMNLPDKALRYATELTATVDAGDGLGGMPIERYEPDVVILDFTQWLNRNDDRFGMMTSHEFCFYRLLGPEVRVLTTNGHHIIELPCRSPDAPSG